MKAQKREIVKWGNSLAVRIPQSVLTSAHLHLHDFVDFSVEDEKIILKPVAKIRGRKRKKYTLTEVLEGYERSDVVDFGKPQGREIL
ncbi:MAG: antitoxin component of MazEF toxin-antitoxin module [bacterium]|jgi:antitoxin component of MazEF toxin-antitoxin module